MTKNTKNIMRIAALILSIICAAALASCGYFVDSFLSDYTGAQTSPKYEFPLGSVSINETVSPSEETTDEWLYPETTVSSGTEGTPQTVYVPETTAAPETTEPSNIPVEFKNHIYLDYKNSGNCAEMIGKVNVYVIFVNDPQSTWNSAKQNELMSSLSQQEILLEQDASAYGKSLDITFSYTTANIKSVIDTGETTYEWQDEALASVGLRDLENAQTMLANTFGGDSNPIVFVVNKTGRAYANSHTGKKSERVTMFSSDYTSFRHELCHLYGARDFYYPTSVENLANKYISESIMCRGERIDELTAFLIGWDDELDANAYSFLSDTNHLTEEYLEAEREKQSITGNVVDHPLSYGTYTGYLERGIPFGKGKIVYSSGDTYEGDFYDSDRHGSGKYTWVDGNVYEGDWVNGQCHGKGKFTWTSGNVYEGDWVNGERTGKGTYTWTSGDVYIGDYVEGKRTGKGKYIWANGDVYEGDFVNNVRNGYGTITYISGNSYAGEWLNGYRHGQGTYKYYAGHIYTGMWQDGERTGKGRMEWSDGSSYDGEWLNNKRHGYGKYINKYGQTFEGQWQNDVFQG